MRMPTRINAPRGTRYVVKVRHPETGRWTNRAFPTHDEALQAAIADAKRHGTIYGSKHTANQTRFTKSVPPCPSELGEMAESFNLCPARVAGHALREAPAMEPDSLARTIRGCVIAAQAAYDAQDRDEHAAILIRLQIIATELAGRLPLAPVR